MTDREHLLALRLDIALLLSALSMLVPEKISTIMMKRGRDACDEVGKEVEDAP
jgi:hypothetical protein